MLNDKERENREGLHNEPVPAMKEEPATEAPQAEELASHPVMELPEIPAPEGESEMTAPVLPAPVAEEAPKRRAGSGWKLFAAAVALVAVGAGVGSATTMLLASQFQGAGLPIGYEWAQSAQTQTISSGGVEGSVVPTIYRKLAPSVVKIDVRTQSGWSSGSGSGSGFVVDSRGYLLTNFHVIQNATDIRVKFVDGTSLAAQLVGSDRYKDLALIKVDPGNRSLIPAPLGNSDEVEIGELAIAIGSPLGHEFSVTTGIISALNRRITGENNPFSIPGSIQTDAAINPGNSGGPLINSRGEVIGINTAIDGPVRGNVGIGFAVPINAAKEVLPAMMAGEQVRYAYLGVNMADLTPAIAERLGVDVTEGVLIREAYEGSPAAEAGLRSFGYNRRGELVSADIVIDIDGVPMRTTTDLADYVASKRVGDQISMTVVRGKERVTLTAVLGDRNALTTSTNR